LQVSLLTDFINHLYRVCVPVGWKFVPDPWYPWMTLEIRDAIRRRDQMRTGTVTFRSAKQRQVAEIMRSASARFVERDFDPGLSQRVLLSNFRRLGFCNSSDFSSLGVGVEDFADYFANVPVPAVQIPTAGGFSFCYIDLAECFSAFKSITSNADAVGANGVSVKFFKLLLPFICCHVLHVFNHAITSSVFPSMWKVAIIRPVAKVDTPSGPSDFHPISIVSDVGIIPRLL
jgi:hypothetical protein